MGEGLSAMLEAMLGNGDKEKGVYEHNFKGYRGKDDGVKTCFCIGKECKDSSCPLSGAYKSCDCCGK